MKNDIYVILGIDTETDIGSFTPFYESIEKGLPCLLKILDKKGVKSTFFFTGDVSRNNPNAVKAVKKAGHEIGCHSLFHETVGDELFPIPGIKPLLPEEVPLRIKMATEWVAEASGEMPVSFRAPRLWGSTAVCNALEDIGYIADASYPMYFYRERFAPYHPDSSDWTKEGNMRLLEIPNFADMTMESKDGILQRDRDQWPLFRTRGAEGINGTHKRLY